MHLLAGLRDWLLRLHCRRWLRWGVIRAGIIIGEVIPEAAIIVVSVVSVPIPAVVLLPERR